MLDFLLVNPPGMKQGPCFDMPTNLLYLYSALRNAGVNVGLADGNMVGFAGVEAAIDSGAKFVGISVLSPVRFSALRIAKYAKEHGAITVMGGHHAHWMWKQVLDNYPFVDVISFGEGEYNVVDIATKSLADVKGIAWREGSGYHKNSARRYGSLDDIAFPAWDAIDMVKYHSSGAIGPRTYYSRGCGSHCKFCNSTSFWRGYRHRSPKNFCDELELLYNLGEPNFIFGDDNATGQEAIALFREILSRKGKISLPIDATTRVDSISTELCSLMKDCGVRTVCLGIESGSQRVIDHMDKRITVEDAKLAMRTVKDAGMAAVALMITNSIGETEEDRTLSSRFLAEVNPDGIGGVGSLWLYPGTSYYKEVRSGKYDSEIVRGKELVNDDFFLKPEYAQHVIAWNRGTISPQKVTDDI